MGRQESTVKEREACFRVMGLNSGDGIELYRDREVNCGTHATILFFVVCFLLLKKKILTSKITNGKDLRHVSNLSGLDIGKAMFSTAEELRVVNELDKLQGFPKC